jgi:hypothetical protein
VPLTHDKQFQMRVSDEFVEKIDEWRRSQADIPGRAEAIRRLVSESLGKRDTQAPETTVGVALSTPPGKSEELLRAAILAFADEIADAPDDFEEFPGEGAKDYEAKVRQAANSPYIDLQALVDLVDRLFISMNKVKAAGRRRRKK